MTFPTTPTLDSFNRANTPDITGSESWVADPFGITGWSIDSNKAVDVNPFLFAANIWNNTFTDTEVYLALHDVFHGANELAIGARYSTSPQINGYFLYWLNNNGSQTLGIWRHDNGSPTQLGADIPVSLSASNYIGLSVIGTTLTAYVYQSSVWTNVGTRTDSNYSSGKLWFYGKVDSTALTVDDYSGGEFVPSVVSARKFQRNSILGV